MLNTRLLFSTTAIFFVILLTITGCGGNPRSNGVQGLQGAEILPLVDQEVPSQNDSNWPTALPVDKLQPWENLDEAGNLIPTQRDYFGGKALSMVNAESVFSPGVEWDEMSVGGVAANGEAAHLASGDAGSSEMSWARYRLEMGGEQPGVVSIDANLLSMSDTKLSSYFVGLSDYGNGCWKWHGPFTDSQVRISTGEAVAGGANYLTSLGNLNVCVVAYDGAGFDLVCVAANAYDAIDTDSPAQPTGLAASPVAGGLELTWDNVDATDFAGYRIYHSTSWLVEPDLASVTELPFLEGTTHYLLPTAGKTYVRISAVDTSGNESALSDTINGVPLAGDVPEVRLTVSAPNSMLNDVIALQATGADNFDWDLDGDGIFELPNDPTGTQDVDTSRFGMIRPAVRGTSDGGNSVTCGAVTVIVGINSRPLADGMATPAFGAAPLGVTFTGTGEDSDGSITSFSWDFDGDGTYDYTHATEPNPPLEMYNTPGTFNVKFRVEDDLGLTDVDTLAVNVSATPNDPPTAAVAIGVGEERGNIPHVVNFDASGSTDSDGTIVEYVWDFDGDGDYDEVSAGTSIAYTYLVGGSFTAAVRVQDDDGAQDVATVEVGVNFNPTADLTSDVTSGDPPFDVNFNAGASSDSDGTVADYEWDLDGDGSFNEPGQEADAQGNATALGSYSAQGFFTAQVRVTDNEGAQSTATLEITSRGWVTLTIDSGNYCADGLLSLAIVNGNPAISYCHYEASVNYVRSTSPTGTQLADWSGIIVIEGGDKGEFTSMAMVEGNPAIAYQDYNNQCLKYVRSATSTGNSPADWTQIVTVEAHASGYTGDYCSLAIVDGNPAIAYEEGNNNNLRYARSTTSTGSSPSDWSQFVTVDNTGCLTWSPLSLHVVDGNPAIAYYDGTSDDLIFARSTTVTGASLGDWTQIVTVDSTNDVGRYPHIAIVDGNPAISYIYGTDGDLRYVRSTNSTGASIGDWTQRVTVDSTDDVGYRTWLAIIGGNPAICYSDRTNNDLKYVRSSTITGSVPGNWSGHTTVDSPGNVGDSSSMIDINGYPAIAYNDSTNEALKYAYYVN